jgi:hypothetical protein
MGTVLHFRTIRLRSRGSNIFNMAKSKLRQLSLSRGTKSGAVDNFRNRQIKETRVGLRCVHI